MNTGSKIELSTHSPSLWVVDVSTLSKADIRRFDAVLGATESAQVQQFRFDADRDAYRAAHALARLALSCFEPTVLPKNWIFKSTDYGRPEVATKYGLPALRFNISHTRGMVAVVVTRDTDCGVDIESVKRCQDVDHLAKAVLAPIELEALLAAPEGDRAHLFSQYWTLKEAYSKAIGLGLSIPFERIVFELQSGGARLLNCANSWLFEQWSPVPGYMIATAIQSEEEIRLIRRWGLPNKPACTK